MTVQEADLFSRLAQAGSENCFYWSDREGKERVVGVGVAWQGERLEDAPAGVRVFGGMRFDLDPTSIGAEWEPFGISWWCAPRVMYRETPIDATLTVVDDGEVLVSSVTRRPEYATWERQVQCALQGEYDKLVLARLVDIDFAAPPLASDLLRRLIQRSPSCYHFLLSPAPHRAFLGCSPERLFSLRDGRLFTEAVAGTRPAGKQEGMELLRSEKDLREHQIVVDRICKQIGPYIESPQLPSAPGLLERRFWQHLWTPISANVKENVSVSTLIHALHPTPAVGGEPKEGAQKAIRNIEGFDRGWYAGVVGWVQGQEAELAVGIRSGLLNDSHLRLYTGCGIVQGSDPRSEWEETETKIQNFLAALT